MYDYRGGVSLITHDGGVHTIKCCGRYKEYSNNIHGYGKIIIGDNTFIGANAMVLPNVNIGKNCVIGAGAIVTHSIPDNSVVAGVPARVIGSTWKYAEKMIKGMPEDWDSHEYDTNMKDYLQSILPDPAKAENRKG